LYLFSLGGFATCSGILSLPKKRIHYDKGRNL
jgi:hypothetical protein